MSKVGSVVLIALMAVICGWFYATPYIDLYQFRKAIDAGDNIKISRHINFPALRESLKSDLAADSGDRATGESNPLRALKSDLTDAMTDRMIEVLVTPEGIAAIMKGEPASGQRSKKDQKSRQTNNEELQYSMGYETLNRFVLKIRKKGDPKEETALVFTRTGLIWMLSAIRLPS